MNTILLVVLEFLKLFGLLHLHLGILVGAAMLANRKFHLSDELFRKMLHLAADICLRQSADHLMIGIRDGGKPENRSKAAKRLLPDKTDIRYMVTMGANYLYMTV